MNAQPNLTQDALEVCWAIEACGASTELTNAVSKASALFQKLSNRKDFGWAVEQLKLGKRVARAGWNGKGMFVFMVPGSNFKVSRAPLLGIFEEGHDIEYRPHIDMKAADGSIFTWNPNVLDVLAEDWGIVE